MLSLLFGEDATVLRERNFQLLLLANTIGPLGTAVMSPVLDSLVEPLGASPATIGLLMSAFSAPPIVAILLAGHLADRYGRKPILVLGLLLVGTGGTAISFTTDFRVALGLRLIQGVGFSAIVPIVIASIGDMYDGTEEATAQGFRFTSSGLTQTVFPLLAGAVVVFAWQYPFFLFAVAFPIAAIVLLCFDEPAGRTADRDLHAVRSRRNDSSASLLELLSQPRVQAIVIARGLPALVWIGFLTYNSIIVVRLNGGTPTQAGVLAAVGSLSFAAAATQAGRITNRFDREFVPLVASNIALGIGFLVVLFQPTLLLALCGIALAGGGFGILMSIYRSLVTGLAPPELRGTLVSIAESNGRFVFTLTPIAMGGSISALTPALGFRLALQTTGVLATVVTVGGGILCLLVARAAPPVASE